jgi:hypothetical protein
MKKYELILLTRAIRTLQDSADILIFLTELVNKFDANKLFLSYQLTLLVFNIVLNNHTDISYLFDKNLMLNVKQMTINIIQQLYKANFANDTKLKNSHLEKITSDIDFIIQHKEYTYFPDISMVIYYFFF